MTADDARKCESHEGFDYKSLGAIDRIGNNFCESSWDFKSIEEVQRYRSFRMRCLTTTLGIVDSCGIPTRAAVSVRLKRLDSIRRKLNRKDSDFRLGRLDDIVGVRVICEDVQALEELSDRMDVSEHCFRVKDYITNPSPAGYRGINHLFRFEQPVSTDASITVRFEVQVRSYLQHRWAVWSEAHGEAVKLGKGSSSEQDSLRSLSEEIAVWESVYPAKQQLELPRYSGDQSVVVCWRMREDRFTPYHFEDDVFAAVHWLEYLETTNPGFRENALLLIGVSLLPIEKRMQLVRLTHPLFTGARNLHPQYWMPRS